MLLHIQCLNGAQLYMEHPDSEQYVLITAMKQWVITELYEKKLVLQQSTLQNNDTKINSPFNGQDGMLDTLLNECFIMYHGNILSDGDHFDTYSLGPTGFFVCAIANLNSAPFRIVKLEDDSIENGVDTLSESCIDQLVAMGYARPQAEWALRQANGHAEEAVAILTGELSPIERDSLTMRRATKRVRRSEAMNSFSRNNISHASACKVLSAFDGSLASKRILIGHVQQLEHARSIASSNPFESLMCLKDNCNIKMIETLVQEPSATLQYFTTTLVEEETDKTKPIKAEDVGDQPSTSNDEAKANAETRSINENNRSQRTIQTTEVVATDNGDTLSNSDIESITRLTSMGFDREVVTAVFIACDKDEQYAVNSLLEMS